MTTRHANQMAQQARQEATDQQSAVIEKLMNNYLGLEDLCISTLNELQEKLDTCEASHKTKNEKKN